MTLIIFKVISIQVANIKIYFTPMRLELDKKVDQTIIYFYLDFFI